jgi:hypothetical protein
MFFGIGRITIVHACCGRTAFDMIQNLRDVVAGYAPLPPCASRLSYANRGRETRMRAATQNGRSLLSAVRDRLGVAPIFEHADTTHISSRPRAGTPAWIALDDQERFTGRPCPLAHFSLWSSPFGVGPPRGSAPRRRIL